MNEGNFMTVFNEVHNNHLNSSVGIVSVLTEDNKRVYKKIKDHSQPPSRVLDKWIVKKGIAPRDEKGRFMSRKSISFLIARSIGRNGIQGISFFQKPLQLELRGFLTEVTKAFKQDILNNMKK